MATIAHGCEWDARLHERSTNCAGSAPSALPRVLMITHRTPFPPDKGDRIRTYNVLRFLASVSRVDLATLADEPVSDHVERGLRELANRVEIVRCDSPLRWMRAGLSALRGRSATEGLFASRALARRVELLLASQTYDLILAVCSSMAQYVPRKIAGRAKVVVDLIDVDSQKWFDYAAASTGWRRRAYAMEGRRVRRLESDLAQRCDQLVVTTEAEAECFRSFQPNGRVAAVANGVDFEYFRPDPAAAEAPHSCVFVGALDYRPNVDAMEWFCSSVWPTVRTRCPEARLSIVGRRPVPAIQKLAELPGVEVIADVPDVRPYLAGAAVAVAPLRIARGVQNKVLEAFAAGKAVITSPQALEGLEASRDRHVVQAREEREWVEALVRLWNDSEERRRLGAAARSYVVERHSWVCCLAPLKGWLARGGSTVSE
jgi:sugar transferase (PEP-CTERM/EpsH1 system associated)